jgi:uncharacterized protein
MGYPRTGQNLRGKIENLKLSPIPMLSSLEQKRDALLSLLREMRRVVVAFSAGVDSTVVAKAARLALGDDAIAVTAVSSSLAEGELDEAKRLAEQIGIAHHIIATSEFENPDYAANPGNRCYFCKTELYSRLEAWLPERDWGIVVNGANLDDKGDHRPGIVAASEHKVRSPLMEAGLTKSDVRQLARHWDLPVWDKPAMPCLSSRIAYGVAVTPERVSRIDQAERFLRERLDQRELRVRLEAGELARIEVPLADLPKLLEPDLRQEIAVKFRELGFRFITLDLEGFRSGSLNAALPASELQILGS